MKKTIKRTLSVVISLVMVCVLFAGCGKTTDAKKSVNTSGVASEKEFNVNPEDYRGKTVTYVTWKDPKLNEDGKVVDDFEKKYGIKVKIDLVDQHSYVSTIAASISAGTQGDVIFVNGTFPGSLSVMQPLDKAKLNLNDPIWNKTTLQKSTVEGHPYLVDTISNVWSEVDICLYNKALFEQNGITTPTEYYEAGNWTMETFKKACQDITALGKGYIGATVLGEIFMGICGTSTYKYQNGKFKTNINQRYYDATTLMSQMFNDGLISPTRKDFNGGKVGMALTNCFGLKRTGYYSDMNSDTIAATYLPRYDANSKQVNTGIYRGWGLIKGAKNPEAAGIFLREYLDVNNYDLDATFHNKDVENFFFKITGEANDIDYYYTEGMAVATGKTEKEIKYFEMWSFRDSPDQVRGYIDKYLPTLNYIVEQTNKMVESERKWLVDNYGKK